MKKINVSEKYFSRFNDGMMLFDMKSKKLVYINPIAEEYLKLNHQSIAEKKLEDIIQLPNIKSSREFLEECDLVDSDLNKKLNAFLFEFKYINGEFFGCVITTKENLDTDYLKEQITTPIALIECHEEKYLFKSYNHAFENLLALYHEDSPISFLNEKCRIEMDGKFRGKLVVIGNEISNSYDLDILRIHTINGRFWIVLLKLDDADEDKITLSKILMKTKRDNDSDSEGYLLRIDYYLDRVNKKLMKSFMKTSDVEITNYLNHANVNFQKVELNHTNYYFIESRISVLYDLVEEILNNGSIEKLEFINNCNLRYRIGVSDKSKVFMDAIHQVYNMMNLFEDYEYNTCLFYHNRDVYLKKIEIHKSIQSGIKNNEFVLYAQKIVNVELGETEGFEILVRWQHPVYGLIMPDEFISYAEKSGEIVYIDMYVIQKTFQNIIQHFEELKHAIIHINVSNKTFSSKQFVEWVTKEEFDSIKGRIVFELTEDRSSAQMDNVSKQLRNHGYQLAIDDFGKGYSSFERIRSIGIEYIKIDKSFIDGLTENIDDLLILEAIIGMCNNLKIKVIAEGIERESQLEFLYARKCFRIQGYIFHYPEKLEDILSHLYDGDKKIAQTSLNLMSDEIESKKFYNNSRIIRQDIDVKLNLVTPNAYFADVLGYDFSEFNKLKFTDLIPKKYIQIFKNFIKTYEENNAYNAIMIELVNSNKDIVEGICVLQRGYASLNYQLYIEMVDKNSEFELLGLSHSYLQAFEEAPSGMMIVSSNYSIKNWNRSSEMIFGYDSQDVIDKNIIKLLAIDSEKEAFAMMFQKALKGGIVEEVLRNRNKSGETRIIRWRMDILYDELQEIQEYICVANDITEELKRNEDMYKVNQALEQSQSIIIITDIKGNIEFANQKLFDITGYTKNEVLGKNASLLTSSEEDKENAQYIWNLIMKGEVWEGEFHNKKKDGSYYWTKASIYPVMQNEKISGFVSIQLDITEQKALENMNSILKQKLFEQDKVASIGLLSSGIMHEINNPLSFINGNVKYILDLIKNYKNLTDDDFEDVLEALEDVDVGVNQIKTIATGLKKYIFKGAEDEKEPVDLVEELQTILVVSKNEYKYHANVNMNYNEDIEFIVIGYASKLKQVFMNLIINAAHAIASNKKDSLGLIKIELLKIKDQIIFSISDNGCGMNSETMDRIFEPFYTTKEEGLGSGLGLSVTRQIIEEDHHGSIMCQSELGKGTTFIIKLKSCN